MSSKLAGDKVAPEVVAKYEHDLAVIEAELQALLNDRREVEGEVSAFKKRLPEVELGMDKLEMEVQGGEKRIAEAEKRLAELK
jgi:structural maintenance of chromosome 4